jgi:AcrR family transcriptional regulator
MSGAVVKGSRLVAIGSQTALQDDPGRAVDGRAARREKNRLAAVDAAIELFSEDKLQPDLDEIAQRCGLSSKSVHRYFENSNALLSAAIQRQLEVGYPLYYIHSIGQGPLKERIDEFVAMRLEAHRVIGATARAAGLLARKNATVNEIFDRVRLLLRDQIELQFATELNAIPAGRREARVAAIDALLQFETLDYYRERRAFSMSKTQKVIVDALQKLLAGNATAEK